MGKAMGVIEVVVVSAYILSSTGLLQLAKLFQSNPGIIYYIFGSFILALSVFLYFFIIDRVI